MVRITWSPLNNYTISLVVSCVAQSNGYFWSELDDKLVEKNVYSDYCLKAKYNITYNFREFVKKWLYMHFK